MTRVIVVDDKPENLYLLRVLLGGHGFEVVEARHGAEALQLARANPPDVIISDLLMPVMDGYTLLRHWKADPLLSARPFIVYTATYRDPQDEQLARSLGADGFILKPCEPESFMTALQDVLASGVPASPARDGVGSADAPVMREYSDALIRKLEDKMFELEATNRALAAEKTERERLDTERERLMTAERQARGHLIQVLESTSDAFVALDTEWRYVYVNAKAAEIFGRRREELIGRHIWTEFPEGVGQPFYHAYRRAAAEQRVVELEEYYPPYDRWFENRIFPSPSGLSIFFHDVTDRKRAELARRESEARLRLAIEGSNIGFWEWNLDSNEVYFSAMWKRQLGYAEAEIPDRFEEWESRLHPDDADAARARVAAYVADPRADFENEFRLRHKDGSYRWILARASIVPAAAGEVRRMLGVHIDFTERKFAAEEVVASRAQLRALLARLTRAEQEERVRMAREVHDDLGQLLTSLKMDLGWIEKKLAEPTDAAAAAAVHDRAVAASELIDDTIGAVQRLSAELRPPALDHLGLTAALRERAHRLEHSDEIRCTVEIEEGCPDAPPDVAGELYAIAQEALVNVVGHPRAGVARIHMYRDHGALALDIEDDGVGLRPEHIAAAGSLGLLGMRERAEQCGATVTFAPADRGGRGTCVRIRLPLGADAADEGRQ